MIIQEKPERLISVTSVDVSDITRPRSFIRSDGSIVRLESFIDAPEGNLVPDAPTNFSVELIDPPLELVSENMFIHYAADQIAGLSNLDDVAAWLDLSESGYDLAQATEANRPTYLTDQQNGLPAVLFESSSSNYMATSAFASLLSQPITIYHVSTLDNISGGTIRALFDSNTGSNRIIHYWFSGDVILNAGSSISYSKSLGSPFIITTIIYDGADSEVRENNGAALASGNTGSNSLDSLRIGSFNFDDRYYTGRLGEFLIYSARHTEAQRLQNNEYLAEKWGITL